MAGEHYSHILLKDHPENYAFTSPPSGWREKRIPDRDRNTHSLYLRKRLNKAWQEAESEQSFVAVYERQGVYLEFKSDPGDDLVIKSLEDMRSKKIRLLNVRTEQTKVKDKDAKFDKEAATTYATVYVANSKKDHFLKKINEYQEKETRGGRPQNADLVNSISDIHKAFSIDSFWVDDRSLIPGDDPVWCEVWSEQ
ncbi:MAG: hypothetical protein U5R06_21480 [candidate division KSB1 bacterium]|nr:hypothetical protein [candidate division KSB1 bacterium]